LSQIVGGERLACLSRDGKLRGTSQWNSRGSLGRQWWVILACCQRADAKVDGQIGLVPQGWHVNHPWSLTGKGFGAGGTLVPSD
jgi:hypothetical protein